MKYKDIKINCWI